MIWFYFGFWASFLSRTIDTEHSHPAKDSLKVRLKWTLCWLFSNWHEWCTNQPSPLFIFFLLKVLINFNVLVVYMDSILLFLLCRPLCLEEVASTILIKFIHLEKDYSSFCCSLSIHLFLSEKEKSFINCNSSPLTVGGGGRRQRG